MSCKIIDRFVFGIFIASLVWLSWFTLSVVDNHEKWENCSWNPHEFCYTGECMTKKWGKGYLYTCRNCGFQYVQLRGVSTNGETENVMAIKSVFSSDFDECYVEYVEMYSLPKYVRVKDDRVKPLKDVDYNGEE